MFRVKSDSKKLPVERNKRGRSKSFIHSSSRVTFGMTALKKSSDSSAGSSDTDSEERDQIYYDDITRDMNNYNDTIKRYNKKLADKKFSRSHYAAHLKECNTLLSKAITLSESMAEKLKSIAAAQIRPHLRELETLSLKLARLLNQLEAAYKNMLYAGKELGKTKKSIREYFGLAEKSDKTSTDTLSSSPRGGDESGSTVSEDPSPRTDIDTSPRIDDETTTETSQFPFVISKSV